MFRPSIRPSLWRRSIIMFYTHIVKVNKDLISSKLKPQNAVSVFTYYAYFRHYKYIHLLGKVYSFIYFYILFSIEFSYKTKILLKSNRNIKWWYSMTSRSTTSRRSELGGAESFGPSYVRTVNLLYLVDMALWLLLVPYFSTIQI